MNLSSLFTTKRAQYASIQNPAQYRALRKRGFSKAEAAKISNGRTAGHTVKAESEPGQLCPYCTADLALPDVGWYRCGSCEKAFYAEDTDSDYEDYHCFRADRIRSGTPPQPGTMPTARVLAPPRTTAAKAANYSAHVGQTINGALGRGTGGKFANSGSGSAPAPKRVRGLKKPKKAAATPQQRKQERETAAADKKLANWNATSAAQKHLSSDEFADMTDFAEGANESPDTADALIKKGVMERGLDGSLRLTPAGRMAANAADRGDTRGVNDALSQAQDRKQTGDARQTAAQQRHAAVLQRLQANATKRQAAADAKKKKLADAAAKPKGGGGGGSKKPAGPSAQDALDQQMALLGRLIGRKTKDEGRRQKAPASRFTVFKDARGQWRWVALSSNAYQDRDGEIVSTKALTDDVARADRDGKYGPLRYWHEGNPDPRDTDAPWGPGVDLGWCDFNAMDGRILVESGTFATPEIGEAMARNTIDQGVSIAFLHPPDQPTALKVFEEIQRIERSLAPPKRVSNVLTAFLVSKELTAMAMPAEKIATLKELGVTDEMIATIDSRAALIEKTAADQGVRFKTVTDAEGVVYNLVPVEKAAFVPAVAAAEIEDKAPPAAAAAEDLADGGADDALENDTGDLDPTSFVAMIVDALMAKLEPILGLNDKVGTLTDHLKGMGVATTKKDASDLERDTKIAALELELKTLRGEQPPAATQSYRPSESPLTVIGQKDATEQPAPTSFDFTFGQVA